MGKSSKSQTAKREKHAQYFVVFAEQQSNSIVGPVGSKSEAMRAAEQRITEQKLVGPFALLKTRTDVVTTFDLQTVEVVKLAKL